jgi:hypothetical protein
MFASEIPRYIRLNNAVGGKGTTQFWDEKESKSGCDCTTSSSLLAFLKNIAGCHSDYL